MSNKPEHDDPLTLKDLREWMSGEWKLYARRRNTDLLISVGSSWAKVLDTSLAATIGEPIELYYGNDFAQAIRVFNRHS